MTPPPAPGARRSARPETAGSRCRGRGSSGPVVLSVLAVEVDRRREAVPQRDARLPAGRLSQPRVVDVDRADVDLLALRWPRRRVHLAAHPCEFLADPGDVDQGNGLLPA